MSKNDQIRFIKNLTGSVAAELISKIESGKVPENWDGFELREILSQKFKNESYLGNDKRSKKYKEYLNTTLVNNI